MLPEEEQDTPAERELDFASPQAVPSPASVLREPFWGYGDVALIFGLLFASLVLIVGGVGALAYFIPRLRTDPGPLLLPTQILIYVFLYFCFRIVFGFHYGKPVFSSLGWRPTHMNLWFAAGGGVLLAFALSGLAALLHTPKIPSPFDQLITTPVNLVLFGIIAVTVAPLFEELFFRGFIQPLLSRTFGVIAGVLLTAAFFGALHAPEYSYAWQYALFITLAGVVFGLLRVRTNSIIPGVIMHGCFNAVSFAAIVFSKNA